MARTTVQSVMMITVQTDTDAGCDVRFNFYTIGIKTHQNLSIVTWEWITRF